MPHRFRLVAAALAVAGALLPAAVAQPAGALPKLRQAGTLDCQPAHAFFCANMHVACAGQTRIATFAFSVRVGEGEASVIAAGADAAPWLQAYREASITWDAPSASMILRPAGAPGYLRVQEDGHYSWRHYVGAAGVMSVGQCRWPPVATSPAAPR